MSINPPLPPPPTPLGRYRVLAPRAGIRVSPLVLGGASIGDRWSAVGLGAMDKESSFKLLNAYYDAGGNFIDTANSYQDGTSELFIGEWMETLGIREEMIIATKYSSNFKRGDDKAKIKANFTGNNLKSLHTSLNRSLERLRTSYVDILYIHFWDWNTSVEEVMDGLHQIVMSGKALYLGISDTPAWVVADANRYAKEKGKTPFVVYQGSWNVMDRSFEREIIPMARTLGLALAPFNVLAGGKLRTDQEEKQRMDSGEKGRTLNNSGMTDWLRNEDERKMSAALEKVAKELGTEHITAVAIAYVMQKAPYVFPIIGGRKVEQLQANIEALTLSLTEEQIKYLESIIPFDLGFPTGMIGDGAKVSRYLSRIAHEDRVAPLQAIKPSKL